MKNAQINTTSVTHTQIPHWQEDLRNQYINEYIEEVELDLLVSAAIISMAAQQKH